LYDVIKGVEATILTAGIVSRGADILAELENSASVRVVRLQDVKRRLSKVIEGLNARVPYPHLTGAESPRIVATVLRDLDRVVNKCFVNADMFPFSGPHRNGAIKVILTERETIGLRSCGPAGSLGLSIPDWQLKEP
jgi:hypothetical protein